MNADPFSSFASTNQASPFDSNDPFASSNTATATTSNGFDDVWSSDSKPAAKNSVVSFDDAFGPSGDDNWANVNQTKNNNSSSNHDSNWAAFDDGINITLFSFNKALSINI
jgi:hypothetical protein